MLLCQTTPNRGGNMMRQGAKEVIFCVALVFAWLAVPGGVSAQTTLTRTLLDVATYLIEVPANWNGTLFLYSHGYVAPGVTNPAQDVGDPATRFFMLSGGFALAPSSYATTGSESEECEPARRCGD